MKKSILPTALIFSFLFFTQSIQAQNLFVTAQNGVCAGEFFVLTIGGGQAPYIIDWGDGTTTTSDQPNIDHVYFIDGVFTITVSDATGQVAETSIISLACFFDIIGDTSPCVGECVSYVTSNGAPGGIVWEIYQDGNIIHQTTDGVLDYCWDEAGFYLITANDFTGITAELNVNVTLGSAPIEIVSLSNAFCLSDSLGGGSSCEKICANSTAIYTVPGAQNVVWEVLGAESFTTNGNQVEVEWGAPGSGFISATAVVDPSASDEIVLNCSSNLTVDAGGLLFTGDLTSISGGTPPYTFGWTGPNGYSSSGSSFALMGVGPDMVGEYIVTVTDSDGASGTCSVFLTDDNCIATYYIDVQDASSCNACDGEIFVNAVSPNGQGFTYQWSNGTTTQSISDLCSGSYSVTAVDNVSGCEIILPNIFVSCDSIAPPQNNCPSTTSLCIDILEDPDANFSTIPAAVNGVVSICEGGTVVFNNESVGASIFEWSFGNGNVSTAVNTEQTYPTAGTYEAYLISRNDCYCSDTTFITIEVEDAVAPELDCVGTLCENATATYTTSASCGTYNWTITGDYNIIDGGGTSDDFITIEWLTGPQGIIELEVAGCAGGNFCLEPTVEVIPIISDNATIKGPESVCRLDEATYFIDDYSATEFTWTVSTGGTILEGQNTSSIKVRWDGPVSPNTPQWVSVDYENCYLGCGGSDTKDVFILPEMYIAGSIEVCENEISTHSAEKDVIAGSNEVDCNWTVANGLGTVVWTSAAPTNSINLDWNVISTGSGRYAITAIPANALEVCTDEFTSYINVVQPPSAPTGISGPTQICPGETYTFEANTTFPNYLFNWTINDGGVISTQEGRSINIAFGNTPPYVLSVTQTSTDGLACESSAASLEVFPIGNFTVAGDNEVCVETEGSYTAEFFENEIYEWSVLPADAGTIVSGQNTNSVQVFWHTDGAADLNVTMCTMTETLPVTVIAKPQPTIIGDLFICPGETTTIGTAQAYSSYLWKSENGNTITNTSTVDLGPGAYEVVVTNSFGCENNESFIIDGFPQPEVSISIPGSWGRCYQGLAPDPPAELQAMEVPAGFTYQWYQDNVLIPGATNSTYTTMDFGNFYVAVTDQNGCETFSKVITIFELCNFGGGVCNNPGNAALPCQQGTDVQLSFTGTADCDIFNFQIVSGNFVPGTVEWDFDDPSSGADNVSVFENPSHQFSRAGHFIVTVEALTTNGQLCWDSKLVTVPIVPNFDFGYACENEPMSFEDLTGNLPGESVQGWSWDFDDPTSGANNTSTDQNPMHIFASAGTYDVTLTVTHVSGCSSEITKTVTVETPPTIDFVEPTLNCQGSALSFVAQPSADVIFYDWDFGDPASGDANTSEIAEPFHEFGSPGNYNVTCTVTDVWGCTDLITKTVTVEPNTLGGAITFSIPPPLCDGDATTMTAPSGGTSWEWSGGVSSDETLTTGEAGAYKVTITNDLGCQYISPEAVVDIIPLPSATIQAVEYDEFGNPVNVFYDNYSTCEGEDVFLQVVDNANYTYTWSDGTDGNLLEYSEDRGNQLTEGTYTISLDILDQTTGCSSTVGPFEIVIHPTPTDIQISASPAAPICENTLTTFTVDNISPDLTYVWNTGELGTSIQALAGGEYFVRGITQFGCVGESNKLEIVSGPDINKIPDGCHTRCNPDTICLPNIVGVVDYQWFLDGNPIAAPNGTTGELIASESGEYQVVMTDFNGCETTSDILTLDLFDGFGSFEGSVYMDVNGNGIIDGPDTLVSGIDIILTNGGIALDTVTSGVNGAYTFEDILSTQYNLQLDLTGLPPDIIAIWNNLDSTLVGCDVTEQLDWLLQLPCPTMTQTFTDDVCFGETYIFDGVSVPPGVPTDFSYLDINGCDSIVTVTITELPDYNFTTNLNACDGDDIIYNGQTLIAGNTYEFPDVSPEGCTFAETVNVIPIPTSTTPVSFTICSDETVEYNNQSYPPGTVEEFVFQNQFGCDSTIVLTVAAYPDVQFDLQSDESCWNANDGTITILNPSGTAPFTYSLDGNNFQADPLFENLVPMQYTVTMMDANDCDMVETVNVDIIQQLSMEIIEPLIPCDGSNVTLQPQFLSGDFSNIIYEWSNGSADQQISINEPGTYLLSATNDCETIVDDAVIMYENEGSGSLIYVPNAFSPNGDGYNDKFKVYASPDVIVNSFDFYIFDRWGNHLYDTHDIDEGWDGSMNNKTFNPGVYVWYIRANITSCGRTFDTFQKGDVTITN